jgi:hypothetical protein
MSDPEDHPAFKRARLLAPPYLASLFPKSQAEAQTWTPTTFRRALDTTVLVVAQTRIECAWSAYCRAVPGHDHAAEADVVLRRGAKLPEAVARVLFPLFTAVPYHE